MLAAACAVGVGCCFAAPIGGRVTLGPPNPHAHPGRVPGSARQGKQDPQDGWHGKGQCRSAGRRKGRAGTILPEV